MPQPWQKPLVKAREAECRQLLDQAVAAGDPDLLEEMVAKMNDVLVVWRRSQYRSPITFSNRQIDAMAASHAATAIFPDDDDLAEQLYLAAMAEGFEPPNLDELADAVEAIT